MGELEQARQVQHQPVWRFHAEQHELPRELCIYARTDTTPALAMRHTVPIARLLRPHVAPATEVLRSVIEAGQRALERGDDQSMHCYLWMAKWVQDGGLMASEPDTPTSPRQEPAMRVG